MKVYSFLNVHPNQLTLLGLAFGILAALATAQGAFLWALGLWWLGRLFDGTDGIWARHSKQSTAFGAYLDISADMLAYSLMMVGFACFEPEGNFIALLVVVMYVLCITTALALGSVIPDRDNRGLALAVGLAEGGETGMAYTLMLLLPAYWQTIAWLWFAILCLTVSLRTLLAYRLLR
jgi:phosphatidylglycerophosphate synthase